MSGSVMVLGVNWISPLDLIYSLASPGIISDKNIFPMAPARRGSEVPMGEEILKSFLDSTRSIMVIVSPLRTPRNTVSRHCSIKRSMIGWAAFLKSIFA